MAGNTTDTLMRRFYMEMVSARWGKTPLPPRSGSHLLWDRLYKWWIRAGDFNAPAWKLPCNVLTCTPEVEKCWASDLTWYNFPADIFQFSLWRSASVSLNAPDALSIMAPPPCLNCSCHRIFSTYMIHNLFMILVSGRTSRNVCWAHHHWLHINA